MNGMIRMDFEEATSVHAGFTDGDRDEAMNRIFAEIDALRARLGQVIGAAERLADSLDSLPPDSGFWASEPCRDAISELAHVAWGGGLIREDGSVIPIGKPGKLPDDLRSEGDQ